MSVYESASKTSVESKGDLITGPWTEPVEQGGENYWRCADCGHESLRRGDLKRPTFHATTCKGSEVEA